MAPQQVLKKKQGVIATHMKQKEVDKPKKDDSTAAVAAAATAPAPSASEPAQAPAAAAPASAQTPAATSKSQPDAAQNLEPTQPTQPIESTKPSDTAKEQQQAPKTPAELEHENNLLRSKITELQHDLHEAQDFLFSLQPRLQTLTEAEAVEEYQSLCAAIEDWVDQKLADSLEEMEVAGEPKVRDIQMLMELIPNPGKIAFNTRQTDTDNIQAAILRFLTDAIFSQDFYCPLPRPEREFVTALERSMRTLQPRRDIRTCRYWRIETYTAASERPNFAEYAQERMWDLTCDMIKMLRVLAPKTDPNSLAKSFYETITKPACTLARKMHLSLDEFTLEWSPAHDQPQIDPATAYQKGAVNYDFVDLNSRKRISVGELDPEAYRVRWMFDLAPKLVFRKLKVDSWGEGKVLARPKVLVRVVDLAKKKENAKKGKEEVEGDPTVLGALERWLQQQYYAQRQAQRPGAGILGFFAPRG
ncbi:hypothetical protein BJY04DRAFT_178097 [Aspergillus karnatakaensis]|uniref:uncharacterized protein n=1 Tax=Aspergillus karnatakaensis TaxID=1810916 RepID=UPI003CCDDEB0